MVPKKVGSITLEYDRGDGVIVSEAFDAEFNNAIIRGDISALNGTFSGKLTVGTLNAVSNLNVRGKSVAITTVTQQAVVEGIFNDDGIYRTVGSVTFQVPASDLNGGTYWAALQYEIADNRGDNDFFLTQYQIVVDGVAIYTSGLHNFYIFIRNIKNYYHEICGPCGPGYHTISFQYRWLDSQTNVYPRFNNILARVDYIRK